MKKLFRITSAHRAPLTRSKSISVTRCLSLLISIYLSTYICMCRSMYLYIYLYLGLSQNSRHLWTFGRNFELTRARPDLLVSTRVSLVANLLTGIGQCVCVCVCVYPFGVGGAGPAGEQKRKFIHMCKHLYTHTHTHIYIHMYMYTCRHIGLTTFEFWVKGSGKPLD